MKIISAHIDHIRDAISSLPVDQVINYRKQLIDSGSSETRFNFDILYAAKLSSWVCDHIYPYATDDHIATVLRKVCRELFGEFK